MGFHAQTIRECSHIRMTKTEGHSQYLFGTLYVPVRQTSLHSRGRIPVGFYVQNNLLVLVDETGAAERALHRLYGRKKWENPALARVPYDFLE